jgi:hypothetical protein
MMLWGTADTEATDLVVFPNDDDFDEDCVRPGAPPLTTPTIFWGHDAETGRLNMTLLFALGVVVLWWWWYPVLERRAHTKREVWRPFERDIFLEISHPFSSFD